MKAAIHPAYNEIQVKCACGHSFSTVRPIGAIFTWKSARIAIRSLPESRIAGYCWPRGEIPPEVRQGRTGETGSGQEVNRKSVGF